MGMILRTLLLVQMLKCAVNLAEYMDVFISTVICNRKSIKSSIAVHICIMSLIMLLI